MEAALRSSVTDRSVIEDGAALVDLARFPSAWLRHEQVRVLHLDGQSRLMADETISNGTINESAVYPREIVRRALELGSRTLILVHNHPSGDPTPSRADVEITRRLASACKLFDLILHDHIVVADDQWRSFRALGLL